MTWLTIKDSVIQKSGTDRSVFNSKRPSALSLVVVPGPTWMFCVVRKPIQRPFSRNMSNLTWSGLVHIVMVLHCSKILQRKELDYISAVWRLGSLTTLMMSLRMQTQQLEAQLVHFSLWAPELSYESSMSKLLHKHEKVNRESCKTRIKPDEESALGYDQQASCSAWAVHQFVKQKIRSIVFPCTSKRREKWAGNYRDLLIVQQEASIRIFMRRNNKRIVMSKFQRCSWMDDGWSQLVLERGAIENIRVWNLQVKRNMHLLGKSDWKIQRDLTVRILLRLRVSLSNMNRFKQIARCMGRILSFVWDEASLLTLQLEQKYIESPDKRTGSKK